MKIVRNIDLNLLQKYGFECGYDYMYEIFHIRTLKNGSWSLVVDEETREVFLYSYKFFNEELSCETKKIKSSEIILRYAYNIIIKMIKDNLIENYTIIPKGQIAIGTDGNLIEIKKDKIAIDMLKKR